MADVELFATGDEIGIYSSVSVSGASNGTKVTLNGVQTLGTVTDVYRIVIRDVPEGGALFEPGLVVDIYAYPDSDPPAPPIYSLIVPDGDTYNGRVSSASHMVFGSPDNIVFDVNGLTNGTVQFGPGMNPPLTEELSFNVFPEDPPVFPCFAAGTLIETEHGPLPIEILRPGDKVRTLDNGLQPITWIGKRRVVGRGDMAPVRISAGALGNYRDLLVSPQHRILIRDWRAEVHFGQPEVLVSAKHLVNGTTIRQIEQPLITYVHFALEAHEVVFAEGLASESLYLGAMALLTLGEDTRREILAVFPELADASRHMETARPCLRSWETRLVA